MNFTYTNDEKREVVLNVGYTILPVKLQGKFRDVLLDVVAYDQQKEDVWPVLDFDTRYDIEVQCYLDYYSK